MEWIKIFASKLDAEKILPENRLKLLKVHGKSICLVRHGDKIYGLQNNCTHKEGSLHLGNINHKGNLVCPLHQYTFQLDTGREVDQRSGSLECFAIRESEDGVFIGIRV